MIAIQRKKRQERVTITFEIWQSNCPVIVRKITTVQRRNKINYDGWMYWRNAQPIIKEFHLNDDNVEARWICYRPVGDTDRKNIYIEIEGVA